MRVIITGATGVAGSGAVRHCLRDPRVTRVTALVRRPLAVTDPKLSTVVHTNFLEYGPVLDALRDHDACLWDLGISQRLVTAAEYEVITHDYALAGARAMQSVNPQLAFCFLSGQGTDSSEKSRTLFARVKGKTENALQRLGLARVHSFRPGYIQPDLPPAERKGSDTVLGALVPLFNGISGGRMSVNTTELAKAMLYVAEHGADKPVLSNRDIKAIAQRA